jgi:hypothetical protein
MTVTYEWVIEETDPTHEVIIDVNHAPTYGEALAFAKQLKHCDLALVRDHETIHGVDRSWAYVENARLPSHLRTPQTGKSSRSPTDTASSSIRATCSRGSDPARGQPALADYFCFFLPKSQARSRYQREIDR